MSLELNIVIENEFCRKDMISLFFKPEDVITFYHQMLQWQILVLCWECFQVKVKQGKMVGEIQFLVDGQKN